MLSTFKAQRSFSHLLCSPPPHETVHSPHSPQLLHTPAQFPIGKVKGKNHKTNSLSGALKTEPKVWLTTLCGGSARNLFPFLPLARVASWSGGRLRARSQMVTIICWGCWNPSALTWSWTECRFHMWRCSHWEGTRQTSLRGPLHQFCHSPICVRTHFTTFYKLRCTMLPPLSLSNVHNWFNLNASQTSRWFSPGASVELCSGGCSPEGGWTGGRGGAPNTCFLPRFRNFQSFHHPPACLLGNRHQAGDLRSHTLSPSSTGSPGQSHRQHQQQQQKSHLIGYWPLEQSNDISALPQPDALAWAIFYSQFLFSQYHILLHNIPFTLLS